MIGVLGEILAHHLLPRTAPSLAVQQVGCFGGDRI